MTDDAITLDLFVDADQVTRALDYRFTDGKGEDIYRKRGRCAGTYHFPKGGQLNTRITVTAKAEDDVQVSVTDLTLVSVPTLPPSATDLSLFDPRNACQAIGQWRVEDRSTSHDETSLVLTSADQLTIVSESGQWQMSGYLSLLVEKKTPTGRIQAARLFYFDPESTTGTGGDVET